jgi:hypothetical protein
MIKQLMLNVYFHFVLDQQVNQLFLMVDVLEELFQHVVQQTLDGILSFNQILLKDNQENKHLLKWIKRKKIELVIEVDHFNWLKNILPNIQNIMDNSALFF